MTVSDLVFWILSGRVIPDLAVAIGGSIGIQLGILLAERNNQKGLEKGMSANQKEMFQREIESYKRGSGRGPGDHIPWAVLAEIAEEIRKNYK